MTKILPLALLVILAGCVAPESLRLAASQAASESAAVEAQAFPAPQEPLDNTPITAVETVGASRTE